MVGIFFVLLFVHKSQSVIEIIIGALQSYKLDCLYDCKIVEEIMLVRVLSENDGYFDFSNRELYLKIVGLSIFPCFS